MESLGERKSKFPPCRKERDKGGAPSGVEMRERVGQPPVGGCGNPAPYEKRKERGTRLSRVKVKCRGQECPRYTRHGWFPACKPDGRSGSIASTRWCNRDLWT